jgi:hypothetical protein
MIYIKQQRMGLENTCTPLELMFVSLPSDAELNIQILFNFTLIKICEYEYKNWTAGGMCFAVQRPLP